MIVFPLSCWISGVYFFWLDVWIGLLCFELKPRPTTTSAKLISSFFSLAKDASVSWKIISSKKTCNTYICHLTFVGELAMKE